MYGSAWITALDIQAALLAHLALERPLWLTVFSGGKSLQGSLKYSQYSSLSAGEEGMPQVLPPKKSNCQRGRLALTPGLSPEVSPEVFS
jgi:hypothetical protein